MPVDCPVRDLLAAGPAALVAGHLAVGAGAFLGVRGLLATGPGDRIDHTFVTLVERLLGLWGYVAAWLLWRGHIRRPPVAS